MAIMCDQCKKEHVEVNGDLCDVCIEVNKNPFGNDRETPKNTVYLSSELFDRLKQLHQDVEDNKKGSKKVLGKFMSLLKSSFINQDTGQELNDPTPSVIIPKHSTLDRIQKILNHNLSVYAEKHDLETPESMQDFTVDDIYSDDFEQSIYQIVDNIEIMQDEELEPNPEPDPEPDPEPEPAEE